MRNDMATAILQILQSNPVQAKEWGYCAPTRIMNNSLEFTFKFGYVWIIHNDITQFFEVFIRNKEKRHVFIIKSVAKVKLIETIDKAYKHILDYSNSSNETYKLN